MARILLIEDDRDMANVLSLRLKNEGFDITIAVDGYIGLKIAHQERPELIILDLMLPAGGGLATLKNLRISTHTQKIPVLVLTASMDEAQKQRVLDVGVSAYLQKPYDAQELISTIQGIINQ